MEQIQQKFESWMVVELFGHQKIAGWVTEETIGGCSFIRVDVPAVNGIPGFTRFFGNGAIYSMTPTTEDVVHRVIDYHKPAAMSVYVPPARQIADIPQHQESLAYDDDEIESDEDDDD